MIKKSILILFLLFSCSFAFGQSTLENDRIAELYDLIQDMTPLYGSQVHIYDYKLKNKRTIKDSSFVAMFSIVDNQDIENDVFYDTLNLMVTKYAIEKGNKIPKETFLLSDSKQVIEHSIVNGISEVLAKTFYKYENTLLVTEEAYTGYAYLENPRMISQVSYSYKDGKLTEKNKKYSLNGEHWIQTWKTEYDQVGRKTVLEEIQDGTSNRYEYKYNDKHQIEQISIITNDERKSTKEIRYFSNGRPRSVLWYWVKKNRPIRMTKYFYK